MRDVRLQHLEFSKFGRGTATRALKNLGARTADTADEKHLPFAFRI
jgi:hypothetical protein